MKLTTLFSTGATLRKAGLGLSLMALLAAGCSDGDAPLDGESFSLQNYFNAPDDTGTPTLSPFFDQIDGTVTDGIEIPGQGADGYIYEFDFADDSIKMSWNTDAAWDQFEPFVGAAGGSTQEEVTGAPLADEYHFTFDSDISDISFTADSDASLVPEVRIEGSNTLVIAIPGGTDIGDGFDAEIAID